ENGPPPIATSERTGLPKPWRPDGVKPLTTAPAPAPDMASQAVISAQPKVGHDSSAKVSAAAGSARGEALPQKRRPRGPAVYNRKAILSTGFRSRISRAVRYTPKRTAQRPPSFLLPGLPIVARAASPGILVVEVHVVKAAAWRQGVRLLTEVPRS